MVRLFRLTFTSILTGVIAQCAQVQEPCTLGVSTCLCNSDLAILVCQPQATGNIFVIGGHCQENQLCHPVLKSGVLQTDCYSLITSPNPPSSTQTSKPDPGTKPKPKPNPTISQSATSTIQQPSPVIPYSPAIPPPIPSQDPFSQQNVATRGTILHTVIQLVLCVFTAVIHS